MNRRDMLTGMVGAVLLPALPPTAVPVPIKAQPISMVGAKMVSYIDIKGFMYVMDVKQDT